MTLQSLHRARRKRFVAHCKPRVLASRETRREHGLPIEFEIRFQLPQRSCVLQILLPRGCHTADQGLGSGGTNREIDSA